MKANHLQAPRLDMNTNTTLGKRIYKSLCINTIRIKEAIEASQNEDTQLKKRSDNTDEIHTPLTSGIVGKSSLHNAYDIMSDV